MDARIRQRVSKAAMIEIHGQHPVAFATEPDEQRLRDKRRDIGHPKPPDKARIDRGYMNHTGICLARSLHLRIACLKADFV